MPNPQHVARLFARAVDPENAAHVGAVIDTILSLESRLFLAARDAETQDRREAADRDREWLLAFAGEFEAAASPEAV